jgi:pyridoxal phosphate enzyme (YggS family)
MATIADNLQQIKERIGRARAPLGGAAEVTLLAVSKSQPAEAVRAAVAAGQKAFGENYVQEAIEKMNALADGLEWHLIGPLQSNKTRMVAERFAWVQTVASEKIARRLSEQRPSSLGPLNVLIQVNVSAEKTKAGVSAESVAALASSIGSLKGIKLRGLMAIPEPGADRARYRSVKKLYDSLKADYGFDTLSLGMSDDMDVAIAEGSTMVRIGTAIFGPRGTAGYA